MIVFKRIHENFAALGIGIHQPGHHILSQHGGMKILILLILNFFSYILYAVDGADDFLELISTIFLASINLLAFLTLLNSIWDANRIYKLLNNIDETIQTSKSLNTYNQ